MKKDYAQLLLSNMSGAVLSYGIVLLGIYSLSEAELGYFTSFIYISAIAIVVFDLGMSNALIKKLSVRRMQFKVVSLVKYKIKVYVALSSILFVYALVFYNVWFASFLLINISLTLYIKFSSTNRQITDDWHQSSLYLFLAQAFRFSSVLIILVLSIALDFRVDDLSMVFSSVLGISFAVLYIVKTTDPDKRSISNFHNLNLIEESRFLFWASVASIICLRADVIIISNILGSESAGQYAKVSAIFFAIPLLLGSVNTVFFRKLQSNVFRLKRIVIASLLFFFISIMVFIVSLFVYQVFLSDYLNLTQVQETICLILAICYVGESAFSLWEIVVLQRKAKYFLFIKLGQLLSLVLYLMANYEDLTLVSIAISFLCSRFAGWFITVVFVLNTSSNELTSK